RITDDVAGVFAFQTDCPSGSLAGSCSFGGSGITLRSPSGGQSGGGSFSIRLSGDALDGVYQATIILPAYSEQGTWTVVSVQPSDKAGNHTYIQGPVLAAAGYPTTITQSGPGDGTPP